MAFPSSIFLAQLPFPMVLWKAPEMIQCSQACSIITQTWQVVLRKTQLTLSLSFSCACSLFCFFFPNRWKELLAFFDPSLYKYSSLDLAKTGVSFCLQLHSALFSTLYIIRMIITMIIRMIKKWTRNLTKCEISFWVIVLVIERRLSVSTLHPIAVHVHLHCFLVIEESK